MKTSRRTLLVGTASLTIAASLAVGVPPASAAPPNTITPVIGGLAAPRGIAFDNAGNMYVAESGVAGSGPAGLTQSGAVNKYAWGSSSPTWRTTFTSLYQVQDPSAPPDVLGPEGVSVAGGKVRMITSESTPGIRRATGGSVVDNAAGRLYQLDPATGTPDIVSNVGGQEFRFTKQHKSLFPSDFPDSNPFGLLVTNTLSPGTTRTFVADAGANTISEVMPNGGNRIVAYIPNESAPPFRDATPTCIAQGPDGYLYVGTLHFVSNLFVHHGGQSDVWRINPNANYPTAPQLWASGLTTITGCTFDSSGHFWATEMFRGGLGANPPGDVVMMRFRHPERQFHIGFGQLPVPGDIAQGPDGAMYVTVGSSAPGVNGGVMRVALQ